MTDNTVELEWVSFPNPCVEGQEGDYWAINTKRFYHGVGEKTVTRITRQTDVPGLHCDLWRVCLWSGNELLAEAPYTAIEACGHLIGESQ